MSLLVKGRTFASVYKVWDVRNDVIAFFEADELRAMNTFIRATNRMNKMETVQTGNTVEEALELISQLPNVGVFAADHDDKYTTKWFEMVAKQEAERSRQNRYQSLFN